MSAENQRWFYKQVAGFVERRIRIYTPTNSFPLENTPKSFEKVQLHEETEEYHLMEEKAVNNLIAHYSDPLAMKQYSPYQSYCKSILRNYDSFQDDCEREKYLTSLVLGGWEILDNCSYQANPSQIQWAKRHARVLMEAIQIQKPLQQENAHDYPSTLSLLVEKAKTLAEKKYT